MPSKKDAVSSIELLPVQYEIAYNWDYDPKNPELLNLYHKGEDKQWIPRVAIDWSREVNPYAENLPDDPSVIANSKRISKMSERERGKLRREMLAWTLSQFMHGEQGALIVAAAMVDRVPGIDEKFYAATQVMDEARHVAVYHQYLTTKLECQYPISPDLKQFLDNIITQVHWDMMYLGMQGLVEGLALAAFKTIQVFTKNREPLLHDITRYIQQDEARHVAFGVLALKNFYAECSEQEIHERVQFIAEGCHLLRERLVPYQVWDKMGFPRDEMEALIKVSEQQRQFQDFLFSTIVPNINKLGLLNTELRAAFDKLGVLQFESWPSTVDEPSS